MSLAGSVQHEQLPLVGFESEPEFLYTLNHKNLSPCPGHSIRSHSSLLTYLNACRATIHIARQSTPFEPYSTSSIQRSLLNHPASRDYHIVLRNI